MRTKRKAPEVGVLVRRALAPNLRTIDERARTIEFVASTEAVDRYGDVIRTSGWQFANYVKNPVFLFGHRSSQPPIGKTVELKIETTPIAALVQKVEFADAATYPFADTVFQLYKGGFMRAVSVGFMPLDAPKEMKDANGYVTGYEFTSQELLELSAVSLPANPEALARCVEKGFAEADLREVFSAPSEEEFYKELVSLHEEISLIAVEFASKTVEQALAALKAAGVERGGEEFSVDLLRDAIRGAGASIRERERERETPPPVVEIATAEQFEQALKGDGGLAEFERALGLDR